MFSLCDVNISHILVLFLFFIRGGLFHVGCLLTLMFSCFMVHIYIFTVFWPLSMFIDFHINSVALLFWLQTSKINPFQIRKLQQITAVT